MFNDLYRGKRVLITGHTGFKGSWLSCWLTRLGAHVSGYSQGLVTQPSMFEDLQLATTVDHLVGRVEDIDRLHEHVNSLKPDFVFHLAAQAIVSEAYKDPLGTMTTNVLGTAAVLEALRRAEHRCVAVLVTSDKCYENVEWVWGYRENDRLGGADPYSASKAAAEIVFHSYFKSYFSAPDSPIRVATARAGNVIGGGDWAADRIVVDCIKSWAEGRAVNIRSPRSTRPWQHVLEPLSGYLTLASRLHQGDCNGDSFNFGPPANVTRTVLELLTDLSVRWRMAGGGEARHAVAADAKFHEARLLKLVCEKAKATLDWEPTLTYDLCVQLVGDWYVANHSGEADMLAVTNSQISLYEQEAANLGLAWAR